MAHGNASAEKKRRERERDSALQQELRELAGLIELGEHGARLSFTEAGRKRAQEGFVPAQVRKEAAKMLSRSMGTELEDYTKKLSEAHIAKGTIRPDTPWEFFHAAMLYGEFPNIGRKLRENPPPDFVNGPEFALRTLLPQAEASARAKRQVLIELGRTREESSPQAIRSSAIRRRRQTILAPDTPTSSSFGLGQPTILGN